MVYIRIEADISALTYPNKRQAVCYPASAERRTKQEEEEIQRRKSEMGEFEGPKQTGTRGSVPTMQSSSHLSLGPGGETHQLAYGEVKHNMRLAAILKPLILIPCLILRVLASLSLVYSSGLQELAFILN